MNTKIDSSLIAFVSVLSAALVSILSIFIPLLVDWIKDIRNRKAESITHISATTINLLRDLAPFRHTQYEDIGYSAEKSPVKLYSDLQVNHYAWEQAIWPYLNQIDRGRVKNLRSIFERVHVPKEFTEQLSNLTNEILDISRTASNRAR